LPLNIGRIGRPRTSLFAHANEQESGLFSYHQAFSSCLFASGFYPNSSQVARFASV
jgi:hypothetical protein